MRNGILDSFNEKSFLMGEFEVFNADYREVGENWTAMVGYFPYYRLYYVTDCESAFIKLRSETVQLLPNHLYYIPANELVSGKCKVLKHSFIHFMADFSLFNILGNYNKVIGIPASDDLNVYFNNVIKNYESTSIAARFIVSGSIQLLLSLIFENVTVQEEGEKKRFFPVIEYIEKNIGETLTLENLAEVLRCNKTYFANSFKKAFGIAPMQYIISRRIEMASRLLIMTNLPISEIAYGLGYDNVFYFSRLFKTRTNMSPLKYRKEYGSQKK